MSRLSASPSQDSESDLFFAQLSVSGKSKNRNDVELGLDKHGHRLPSLLLLLLLGLTSFGSLGHGRQVEGFARTSSSILAPVYGPLAEQIVSEFQLAEKEGIGIDLGSGPGDLIIELCRRTKRMHWINADINPRIFSHFIEMATDAGMEGRVSAIYADAVALPFRDDFADILVSRGSFQFWKNQLKAFAEIYRVLKPGGVAFVGRGFSDNLPGDVAERIRSRQRERGFELTYDTAETASQLESIMRSLTIEDYEIRIPVSETHKDTRYGIWLEFHKPVEGGKKVSVAGAEPSFASVLREVAIYASVPLRSSSEFTLSAAPKDAAEGFDLMLL